MIKFRRGDMEFECESADEAYELLKRLRAEDERKLRRSGLSPLANLIADIAGWGETHTSPWNRTLFWTFLESLGEPQKRGLALLVRKRRLTDEQLREALQLNNNKQLAGVLSGISKQAGAHDLSARAVYTIENESKSGQVTKSYVVALDFLRIAVQMNWPDE
jgi:hypothetical protein